jgi:drug/metabolite transporter (DMT)-like permease
MTATAPVTSALAAPVVAAPAFGVPVVAAPMRRHRGVVLCLVSGVSFGLAAVFAKEGLRSGFTLPSLLTGRFAIAALFFWVLVAHRAAGRTLLRPSIRSVLTAVGLGAIGYALQSACYFGALTRLNAAVAAQLLYIYPALVLIIALVLRRELLSARKLLALACTGVGLALLLQGGGGSGPLALPGVLMALGAAGTYAVYITVAAGLPDDLDVYLLSAIVCSSAALSVAGWGLVTGSLHAPARFTGWGCLVLFALVPTAVAIVTFLAGLRLVGGSVAAILSCVEPLVTALSVALVYGEGLGAVQIIGGVAVLSAVMVLQSARGSHRAADMAVAASPSRLNASRSAGNEPRRATQQRRSRRSGNRRHRASG